MNSLRNTVILSSLAIMAIVGGIVFYAGKTGSISADVESKDCKFYSFTDRKVYSRGQTVKLGLKNDKYSKCIVKVRNDLGPWAVYGSNNKIVYKASATSSSIQNLKAGDRLDWDWNMITTSGSQIPAGIYKIKFTSIDKDIELTID